jgi:putative membrane protein
MQEKEGTQELAERRTEWAAERTWMAGERSFAAWIRTGLALVAAGLASARLLTSVEPQWLVRAMGTIFVAMGGTIFVLGFRTYLEVARNLKEEEVETTSSWFLGVLTIMLIAVAVLAPILIFV